MYFCEVFQMYLGICSFFRETEERRSLNYSVSCVSDCPKEHFTTEIFLCLMLNPADKIDIDMTDVNFGSWRIKNKHQII